VTGCRLAVVSEYALGAFDTENPASSVPADYLLIGDLQPTSISGLDSIIQVDKPQSVAFNDWCRRQKMVRAAKKAGRLYHSALFHPAVSVDAHLALADILQQAWFIVGHCMAYWLQGLDVPVPTADQIAEAVPAWTEQITQRFPADRDRLVGEPPWRHGCFAVVENVMHSSNASVAMVERVPVGF